MRLFTAVWCNPCIALKRFITEENLSISIELVDVDENPELVAEEGVRGVPTLVIGKGKAIFGQENILNYLRSGNEQA